jgi:hypothetical protein
MSFRQEIRRAALVASARHCCVCQRYKGVRVEVHHIVPEADGGPNTLDNAIVLCFDCHADAGHYNQRHPRGTKFSRAELRAAKEKWFGIVSEGGVDSRNEADLLYCRYLICRSVDILAEILAGDFKQIPVDNPVLVRNECSAYLSGLLDDEKAASSGDRFNGGSFANRDEYLRAHPDAVPTNRGSGRFSFYELLRVPSRKELLDTWAAGRPLIEKLVSRGAEPADVSIVASFFQECGEDHYQEDLITRPPWGAFLAATNVSNAPLTLKRLVAVRPTTAEEGFRAFRSPDNPARELDLPAAPIQQGMTVVIPLGVVLGPLGTVEEETWSRTERDIDRRGPVQVVTHSGVRQASVSHATVGPFLWPQGIQMTRSGRIVHQEMHELDLTNVYTLSRYWETGSCPHLFFALSGRRLMYGGTLLAAGNCRTAVSRFVVPNGVDTAMIAELEDEVTHVDSISLDDTQRNLRLRLKRGQVFAFPVGAGMVVRVQGSYKPITSSAITGDTTHRSALVHEFIYRSREGLRLGRGSKAQQRHKRGLPPRPPVC